jgi:pimeloyl-ACP methyl ester carboxylesterase
MVEWIERLDLEDLTLAGESMGATLSLSVAAELGSRVNRIVALNTYDYPQGVERANSLATIVVKAMRIPGFGCICLHGLQRPICNYTLRDRTPDFASDPASYETGGQDFEFPLAN